MMSLRPSKLQHASLKNMAIFLYNHNAISTPNTINRMILWYHLIYLQNLKSWCLMKPEALERGPGICLFPKPPAAPNSSVQPGLRATAPSLLDPAMGSDMTRLSYRP